MDISGLNRSWFGATTRIGLLSLFAIGVIACDYGPEEMDEVESQESNELKIAQTWGGSGTFGDANEPYYDCSWFSGGCNFVSYNAASFCGDVSPISATKVTVNYVPKLKIKMNWCVSSYDAGCDSGQFRLPSNGIIGTVRLYSGGSLVGSTNITNVSLILSSPYDYGYAYVNTNGTVFDRVSVSISAGINHGGSTTSTSSFDTSGMMSNTK